MKIFFDTNIPLDFLLNNNEFAQSSYLAFETALNNHDTILFSAGSIGDLFYILRRSIHSKNKAFELIINLSKIVNLVTVDEGCILKAFQLEFNDLEDAIIDSVASKAKADIIVTRNNRDFKNSKNKVMTPAEFIEMNR